MARGRPAVNAPPEALAPAPRASTARACAHCTQWHAPAARRVRDARRLLPRRPRPHLSGLATSAPPTTDAASALSSRTTIAAAANDLHGRDRTRAR